MDISSERNVYFVDDGRTNSRTRYHPINIRRQSSILNNFLRGFVSRSRSESMDNNQNKKIIQPSIENKIIKRVQIKSCPVESVYDLREESELDDVYNDSFAFRRPRSNSTDLLILRKTSRPLSVDVIGLVDNNLNPYKQYMKVVDCYALAPHTGSILLIDMNIKLEKALEILNEWDQRAALIWSEAEQCVISIFTLTDLLMYILSGEFNKMSTIYQALSGNKLITLSASCKLLEACEEFCTNQIHRIAITEPSGDILYLLDLKRILETVHKQNRSLHFALWLNCCIKNCGIGTWKSIHSIMEDERLIVAIQKMIDHRISSLPIIDGEGRVVDVISKADLAYNLKFINITDIQEYFHRQRVTECISHRQPTIFPSADHTVGSILDIVLNNRAKCIFVTDSAKHLLAAISLSDFISYILCHEEVPDTTV